MAMIFNIQRYAIHDGQGVRTDVFLKGCPLRCPWCSNPESQSFKSEIFFDEQKCMGFGDCMQMDGDVIREKNGKLVIDRKKLRDTALYEEICPAGAIAVTGMERSVEEVLQEIEKDEPFYRQSGGGVTLTGGEPFSQDQWMIGLIRELNQKQIPVAVETCLHVTLDKLIPFIPLVSEFLIDLKHADPEKFKVFTGGNLQLVLENLRFLDSKTSRYRIRIPVIPEFNHSLEEMKAIIDFAGTLKHARKIDFIPFHRLGESKYRMLGKIYRYRQVTSTGIDELDEYMHYAIEKNFEVTIGG